MICISDDARELTQAEWLQLCDLCGKCGRTDLLEFIQMIQRQAESLGITHQEVVELFEKMP